MKVIICSRLLQGTNKNQLIITDDIIVSDNLLTVTSLSKHTWSVYRPMSSSIFTSQINEHNDGNVGLVLTTTRMKRDVIMASQTELK